MYQLLNEYLTKSITITDEELKSFDSKFKSRITTRNEMLLETGSICKYMYFVNKGCLRVYFMDEHGRESTRFLIPEGRFGTSFPSFILQEPSRVYLQSIEPSDVLYISYPDFRALPDISPAWEKLYLANLERDYIDSIKRIESLITIGAKERYAQLVKEHPDIVNRLPSKIIANYLGISQETLSRLKSKM